jgi:hypothetical protein
MLADKNPGAFALQVHEIELVRGAEPRADSHGEVVQRLIEAVALGVPIYNRGDTTGCRDLYAAALSDVQGDPGLTEGESDLVLGALVRAASQEATEGAWTLRYAIDSVLGSAEGRR